jgi:putative transposase
MPRQAREVEAGFPMHVTQRGNYRQNIFHDDDDKEFYIKSFLFYRRKYKVKLYAWCLMDNHIHVVVEPSSRTGLSKLFQALNTKYVFYFNKKYEISGRLFESRFFSCILNEDHFFEAIRYVELNPTRAGMDFFPGSYE